MGPPALVRSPVLAQQGLLVEPPLTIVTLKGPLTRMDANVLVEDGALPKATGAVRTRERLLVGVNAQVLGQVALLAEALAALRAAEGPRVIVDALVLQHGALLLEVLAAGGAGELAGVGRGCFSGRRRGLHLICSAEKVGYGVVLLKRHIHGILGPREVTWTLRVRLVRCGKLLLLLRHLKIQQIDQ